MSALLRQVAAETATVALAGGILGLAAAHASIRILIAFAPVDIPRLGEVALDARAFGFAAALIATCAGVCVIIPAWRAWRTDAADVLKAGAHSTTASPAAARVRDILVGVEVGLTVGLLILAGLFLASFVRVLRVDPGFAVDRRVAIDLKLPAARYRTGEDRTKFIERLLPLVQSIPGVEAAGLAQKLPLEGEATVDSFIIDKPVPMATGLELVGNHYFASPSYFDAIGMAIVRGRMFAETDRGRRVAVVSELTARTLWPGQEPIGRRFARSDNRREAWEVIGIVANARMTGLEHASGLVAYVPYWDRTVSDMSLVVQSRVDGNSSIAANLRNVLRELDPELPLLKVRTIDDVVDRAVAVRRFQTLLTVLFAAAGLLIACLGIYGVVVSAGERRRAELAVRLALGATRRDVVILVALQAAKPVMAGLVAGSIGAIAGARVIQSMLFEVSPNDPMVIAAVCALVLVIAALACVDPAARAARIYAVTLLRTS